jgi:hypothetical protein
MTSSPVPSRAHLIPQNPGDTKTSYVNNSVQADDWMLNGTFKPSSDGLWSLGDKRRKPFEEIEMIQLKTLATAIAFAFVGTAAVSGSASAGDWYLNAAACPDLREDRRDARYDQGRYDRYEDWQDQRVIDCPSRAWSYAPDRYERSYGLQRGTGARLGTPGVVYASHYGQFYRVNRFGNREAINVVITYPNANARGLYWQSRSRGYSRHDRTMDRRWREHNRRGDLDYRSRRMRY